MSYIRSPAHDFEGNGGALVAGVMHAFEAEDEARMRELDRLCHAGYANTDPKHIPPEVLNPKAQEKAMQLCDKGCGRQVRRRNGVVNPTCKFCREDKKPTTKGHPAKPDRKPRVVGIENMTVPELLNMRRAVDQELRDRLLVLEAERKQVLEAFASEGTSAT